MNTSGQSPLLRQKRSVLFWVFISIAIPAGIILAFYGGGYRIDRDQQRIVRNAALAIETTPRRANVVLNGEIQEDTTPFIRTIQPGFYSIALELDGYRPWEKEVSFEAGAAQLFPDVQLFLDTEPQLLSDEEAATIRSSRIPLEPLDADLYDVYSESGFQNPSQILVRTGEGPGDVVIAPDQKSTYIVSALRRFSDERHIPEVAENPSWNSDRVLLYTTGGEIWNYHYATEERSLVLRQTQPILDAVWHPDGGYILYSDADGLHALELDDRDHRQQWQLSTVSAPSELEINARGNRITFTSGDLVYQLDLFTSF